MAETDVWLKQEAVTEFLVAGGEKLTCIHKHLLEVHIKATVDVSTL
jgi:hypothetical protein